MEKGLGDYGFRTEIKVYGYSNIDRYLTVESVKICVIFGKKIVGALNRALNPERVIQHQSIAVQLILMLRTYSSGSESL